MGALDYFACGYLMFVDESHISLPQVRGMCGGDRTQILQDAQAKANATRGKGAKPGTVQY